MHHALNILVTGLVHSRLDYCNVAFDHTDISEMVDNAEDKLFHKTLNDTSHVLSQLLPERRNELTLFSSYTPA